MPLNHDARTEQLVLIQVLRALAALLVLAGHVQGAVVAEAAQRGEVLRKLAFPGGFGVDLFFCISGFIMVVSSQRLFGTPGAWSTFLGRRVRRLVPLYWIATLALLPALLFGRRPYTGDLPQALASSLLFWPYPTYGVEGEAVFPLHTLGWSLNYEMFFYLVFALCVGLPMRRALAAVCLAMLAIAGAGLLFSPATTALRFWSQPIVLEFIFGVLVGWSWLRGRLRMGPLVEGLLVTASLALLAFNPLGLGVAPGTSTTPNDLVRLVSWGLPAAGLVLAAVSCEGRWRPASLAKVPAVDLLRRIGDSSYSLYLLHPFALILGVKLWAGLGLGHHLGWPVLAIALFTASVATGWLGWCCIERPAARSVGTWPRLWRGRGAPSQAV